MWGKVMNISHSSFFLSFHFQKHQPRGRQLGKCKKNDNWHSVMYSVHSYRKLLIR